VFVVARSTHADVPTDLIIRQRGELPIILSAPHGGNLAIPDTPERTGEGLRLGAGGFVTVRDINTDKLAIALSAAIDKQFDKKPYLVVAQFRRKFVDVNRQASEAYEHPNAQAVYDTYHGTLDEYARAVQKQFGRGLVIDLHGQSSARDTIFRGTQNGKTVAHLVARFGPTAHVGPKSLVGLLSKYGMKLHPLDDGREQAGFAGGYITQTYGGMGVYGLDAIQLEFGGEYSDLKKIDDTAAKLAGGIEKFAELYLSLTPAKAQRNP